MESLGHQVAGRRPCPLVVRPLRPVSKKSARNQQEISKKSARNQQEISEKSASQQETTTDMTEKPPRQRETPSNARKTPPLVVLEHVVPQTPTDGGGPLV